MGQWNDAELLSAYVNRQSEPAFEALVERYVALVYSAALRQVHNPQLAEEVTQATFILLAQKARRLNGRTLISGWLCHAAYYVARNALKTELRRRFREKEAYMQSLGNQPGTEAWQQFAPMLDEAVAQLNEADRNAVVLRFYQQKPLNEVGGILGIDPDTAQKRVSRALEKLRKFFTKRGVVSTTAVIAGAISSYSVQAAPAALAKSVTAVAIAKAATASTSTLALAKGTFKIMAWSKTKTLVVAGILLIAGTGALLVNSGYFPTLKAQNIYIAGEGSLFQTPNGFDNVAVGKYRLDGSTVNASLISGFPMPRGIAISGNDVFISNEGNTIAEYTTSGQLINSSLIKKGLHQAFGIAISGNDLFVVDYNGSTGYTVGEYTTSGKTVHVRLISGVDAPFIAVSGKHLYVTIAKGFNESAIGEYTTSGKAVNTSLISGLKDKDIPASIAISGDKLFFVNDPPGPGHGFISEYTTSGRIINASLISGLYYPTAIVISGNRMFVVNEGSGTVGEYTTSGVTVHASLISGLIDAEGIVIH